MSGSGESAPILSVRDLRVWFGHPPERVDAVRGVDLDIARGESFGLVGESGSGKSTILRAVAGLIPTWSGQITADGETLSGMTRSKRFHRRVQMVFQDPYASLHPRHTVDRVLAETLKLQGMDDIDRRIVRLLDDVGLGQGFRFRYPHQLSGGQRQRVAVARALAGEPEIVLLDEPTSALDVSVQAEILNLLADLRSEKGLTYIMVSHDLAVVGHLCQRLAVMQTGQVVDRLSGADLRAGRAENAYTRHLIAASLSYDGRGPAGNGSAGQRVGAAGAASDPASRSTSAGAV